MTTRSSSARLIEPPARASPEDSALVLVLTALLIVAPLARGAIVIFGAAVVATAAALATRAPRATPVGLVVTLGFLAGRLPGLVWPLPFLLALVLTALITSRLPWTGAVFPWLRRGRLGRTEWLLVLGAVVTSSAALVLWFELLHPDVHDAQAMIRAVPGWALPFVVLGFPALIALTEEATFRGVLLHSLESAVGRGPLAISLQAVAFGVGHVTGFPRGAVGVGLAVIYGLMVGAIRVRARGLLAPWIAHVCADTTIAVILIALARG